MRDFGAILRKAQETSKIGGNTGYCGNAEKSSFEIRAVGIAPSVSTPEVALATVDTNQADRPGDVATVASRHGAVDTFESVEIGQLDQQLAERVSTVASVSTENNEVLKKSASAQIRWAALRNSIDLFELQTDTAHCFVCHEREDCERPFIPVCTASPGRHHWIHLQCHGAHIDRIKARVDAAFIGQDLRSSGDQHSEVREAS